MKKISISLAVVALLLASLACQTVMGGRDNNTPIDNGGVPAPTRELGRTHAWLSS